MQMNISKLFPYYVNRSQVYKINSPTNIKQNAHRETSNTIVKIFDLFYLLLPLFNTHTHTHTHTHHTHTHTHTHMVLNIMHTSTCIFTILKAGENSEHFKPIWPAGAMLFAAGLMAKSEFV